MFQENCYDRNDINTNFFADNMTNDIDVDVDINGMNTNMNMDMNMNTCPNRPIIEPMRERCVNRTFVHEVPHVCPINTRIINNHIYRHTYQPRYTCCEENVVTQEQCGSCCCFR